MEKIIKPTPRASALLIFMALLWLVMGLVQGTGAGFVMAVLGGGFFGLLVLFSAKGTTYIIGGGQIKKRHWTGKSETIRLSDIQKTKIKNRMLGTGDLILFTSSGKFKIEKISGPRLLQDELTAPI